MNVIDVLNALKSARKKIEKPENWTQGTFARDSRGHSVTYQSRIACSWCAVGAVRTVTAEHRGPCTELEFEAIQDGSSSIADFNDHSSHAGVLSLFDRTIARLEASK